MFKMGGTQYEILVYNMISPDYVLIYIPRPNGNFGKILNILENFGKS